MTDTTELPEWAVNEAKDIVGRWGYEESYWWQPIAKALVKTRAEERERIEQEITRVCKYAEDYRNYDMRGVDWQSILHPTDLLSSLDKPLTDK